MLAGLFVALLTVLLVMFERSAHDQNRSELMSHVESASAAVEHRIESNNRFLGSMATEEQQRPAESRDQIRRFLDDRPELLTIASIDGAGHITWVEPAYTNEPLVGQDATLIVPEDAIATATESGRLTASEPFQTLNGESGFGIVVPIPGGGGSVLVCLYSTARLLRQTLPRQTMMNHHVALVDATGLMLAALPTGEQIDPDLTAMRVLRPPANGLVLKLSQYRRPFWSIGTLVLMTMCVSLVAGMAWGMWSLKRQVRKRIGAEMQLRRARDELEQRVVARTADLKQANESLHREMSERMRAEQTAGNHRDQLAHASRVGTMGEMAAGLAHELNQPLGSIASYADGVSKLLDTGNDPNDPLIREALREIGGQARHAGNIIRRLREFVAADSPQRTRVQIPTLIEEVVTLLDADMRHNEVALQIDVAPSLPAVLVDRIQIQQVLVNLMRNAIEAMSETAEKALTITAGIAADQWAKISVIDNGAGCDAQTLQTIFEPFFTTRQDGMGMGLSISRSIIEAHDGQLTATSNAAGGLTFCFTLPLAEGVDHATDHDATHADEAGHHLHRG